MNRGVVYALWDYEPQQDDELRFSEGDCLTVLRREDQVEEEWWWARCGDHEGYIPRNLLGVSQDGPGSLAHVSMLASVWLSQRKPCFAAVPEGQTSPEEPGLTDAPPEKLRPRRSQRSPRSPRCPVDPTRFQTRLSSF